MGNESVFYALYGKKLMYHIDVLDVFKTSML